MGGNVRITDGVRGGEIYANYAVNGIGLSFAATGDNFKRPVFDGEQQQFGGGIDVGLRASVLGLAKQDATAHWFDFGGAIGGGGGLIEHSILTTYGQGWVGGWLTLGLGPDHDRYPALVFDVRRQAVIDWDDETVFSVGLAITREFTREPRGFGFH